MKLLYLFVLYLIFGVVFSFAGDYIRMSAPSVIVYKNINKAHSIKFILRIFSTAPELHFEWEYGFQMGSARISKKEFEEGKNFYRWNVLKNGRDIKINGTVMFLCKKHLKMLRENKKVKLKINSLPGWMKKVGETTFKIGPLSLPCIIVEDNAGNRYIFQDKTEFPVCLEFSSGFYTQKAVQYYNGSNVIFRWLHK